MIGGWLAITLSILGQGPDAPPRDRPLLPQNAQAAPKAAARANARGRAADPRRPPACNHAHRTRAARAAQDRARGGTTMPEFFERMARGFATNPAGGFPAMLDELERLEGPALEGIRLSIDEERAAGRRFRQQYIREARQKGYDLVKDDDDRLRYLRDLVSRMARHMEHRDRYNAIDVMLIEAPIADGQCFPGGFLAFTTALLEEPDEATVAAVVAHELAHLDRAHVYDYARRGALAERAFQDPGNFDPAGFQRMMTRGMALMGIMMNPYRPEQESEADCVATTWLFLEGYDPSALGRFIERLHQRLGDRPDQNEMFAGFGRSHPFSLDRRREVAQRLAQLKRWRPDQQLSLFADNLRTLTTKDRAALESFVGPPLEAAGQGG